MRDASLYEILGILETASDEEIRKAYRRKMRFVHPDRGGSEEAAKQINAAYDVLVDPAKRARYDAKRSGRKASCPVCSEPMHSDEELLAHIVRHQGDVDSVGDRPSQVDRAEPTRPSPTTAPSSQPQQPSYTHWAGSSEGQGRTFAVNPLLMVGAIGILVAGVIGIYLGVSRNTTAEANPESSRSSVESHSTTSTFPTTTQVIAPTSATTQPNRSAFQVLFGEFVNVHEIDEGLTSDGLSRSNLRIEASRLYVGGVPTDLVVRDWVCLAESCSEHLAHLEIEDGLNEHVWAVFSESDVSEAIVFGLNYPEFPPSYCVSTTKEEVIVFTYVVDSVTDSIEVTRAWAIGTSGIARTWKPLDVTGDSSSSAVAPSCPDGLD